MTLAAPKSFTVTDGPIRVEDVSTRQVDANCNET